MKTLLLLCLFAGVSVSSAQYAINWFTLDSGGGQSAGGSYTLAGTAGQLDTGFSSGGHYTLTGGFWSFTDRIGTEERPILRIFRDVANAVLAWPAPSTGFELQQSASITASGWTSVLATPSIVGTEKQIRITLEPGNRFYRLHRP